MYQVLIALVLLFSVSNLSSFADLEVPSVTKPVKSTKSTQLDKQQSSDEEQDESDDEDWDDEDWDDEEVDEDE